MDKTPKPLFVSFQFIRQNSEAGMGYRVITKEDVIKNPIKTNEDLMMLRELIKESANFRDVIILNFRRMEA